MGLHLCYELALPAETSREQVLEVLGRLRSRSERIGFDRITEVRQYEGEACDPGQTKNFWTDAWWYFRFMGQGHAIDPDTPEHWPSFRPEYIAGFLVYPGRRCEVAGFGLSYCPDTVTINGLSLAVHRPGWHWHCCCKTQYASVVSDEHLLRCHLGLVDLLDAAPKLGLEVEVRDETGYHEHRDTARLLEEVRRMNRIVAGFAGRLADTLEPDGHRTVSPIFDHPEFEHLEGEGQS